MRIEIYLVTLVFIILMMNSIIVVPDSKAYILEQLGLYKSTLIKGLHFKIPFIHRVTAKVDIREQMFTFPPLEINTKDSYSVLVNIESTVIITSPKDYFYNYRPPYVLFEELVHSSIGDIISDLNLDEVINTEESVEFQLKSILYDNTIEWGIRVNNIKINSITQKNIF